MFFGLDLSSAAFWSAFGSIMLANIVLSGDNAVVIAMAARTLKPEQQKKAIFWGSAAAIVMRIVLTIVAIQLLSLPYLKMIGAVLLVYIGVDLLTSGEDDEGEGAQDQELGNVAGLVHRDQSTATKAPASRSLQVLVVAGEAHVARDLGGRRPASRGRGRPDRRPPSRQQRCSCA